MLNKEYARLKVLLTGATGFIGSNMLNLLRNKKVEIILAGRNLSRVKGGFLPFNVDSIDGKTCWDELPQCDVVIHCAASAHQKDVLSFDELLNINTFGAVNLAREASKKGMQRFVFVSSIGVNGSESQIPFSETDVVRPCSDYALSKYKAENALINLSEELNFELVIVRPSLVYGKGAEGNFAKLVNLVKNTNILPFGAIKSPRSYISVDNLTDFLYLCATHKKAKNQVFLISDDYDLSLKEFIELISNSENKTLYNFPFPPQLIYLCFLLLGKKSDAKKLLGQLQINTAKAKKMLSWKAKFKPNDVFR